MFWHTYWSWEQLKSTEGLIQAKGLLDYERAFWTLTAWEDIQSMHLYRDKNAHRVAMPWLSKIADEISFVYWEQKNFSLPDWKDTHSRMATNGRFYPLKNCSYNHSRKIITNPRILKEFFIVNQ